MVCRVKRCDNQEAEPASTIIDDLMNSQLALRNTRVVEMRVLEASYADRAAAIHQQRSPLGRFLQ